VSRFPTIVGPTAGGKTGLAIALARRLMDSGVPAEVVSCDAIQVYRGMDIGSGKATEEERAGVPHHLIDIAAPTERFSVQQWLELAEAVIGDIHSRGGTPIVVGGTHLYVKAFLEGLFEGPDPDPALRAELEATPAADRRRELERIDPMGAARIHPNDDRRTIRALEVFRLTGTPISELQRQWDQGGARQDTLLVGLDWPPEAINRRINARVRQMVERGLVEEARALWQGGQFGPTACEALGYKQLIEHFEHPGSRPLDEAIERIKIETRRFAKNQRTWLRRLRATPGSLWIDASSAPAEAWPDHVLDRLEGGIASDAPRD